MTHYSHIPLVRIIIPLICGIILFSRINYYFTLGQVIIILTLFFVIGFWIEYRLQKDFQYRFAFGLNAMFFLVFSGYILTQGRFEKQHPNHFSNFDKENALLRVRLIEPVSEKTNTYQIVGLATHIVNKDSAQKVRGKLIAYFQKDSLAAALKYGDIIYMEFDIQRVRPPQNPSAFNFKKFLSNQNIFHQVYRRSGQWYSSGENEGNPVISYAHKMRQKALDALEENGIKGREFSVASALLLGYREYLDEDLQREFAGAGAMHILCVSGLHVGIIFLSLNLILGFLTKLPRGRLLKTLIIIILIWFYAAITGFSPSVLRASTMFSFVALGQSFRQSSNIYNTLAASALILIIMDPFIVKRIGFQLSYIAVISIVWLQPVFYKQLYFKNKALKYAWGIITVSLAAQLGTGPLALYYFNQFPNYFLLTNLAVIPLTGIIIKSGIFFFLSSPVGFLSQLAGIFLSFMVYILHSAVRFIESLPGSTSMNVYISFHETLLIFGVLTLAGTYWVYPRKNIAWSLLTAAILLGTSVSARSFINHKQKKMVVYSVPGGTAIDFFHGKNCYFLACDNTINNTRSLSFHVNENRLKTGTINRLTDVPWSDKEAFNENSLFKRGSFIMFSNLTIKLLTDESESIDESVFPGDVDLLIISQNPRVSIEALQKKYSSSRFIIDSSNDFWRTRRWMEECDSLGIECWSVRHKGAFELAVK